MKFTSRLPLWLGLAALTGVSHAAVNVSGTTTYNQNFDALSSAVHHTEFNWTDDTTITGFYLHRSNSPVAPQNNLAGALTVAAERPFTADGSEVSTTAPNFHGFLSLGVDLNTDRALGFSPTGTDGPTHWAGGTLSIVAIFTNTGTSALDVTSLSYDIEARRANSAAANAETITLTTKTGTAAALLADLGTRTASATFTQTGWTTVPAAGAITNFDYTSSDGFTTIPAAPPSSTTRSGSLVTPIRVNPGQSVALRWANVNDGGTDAQVGIDNLVVQFTQGASIAATAAAGTLNNQGTVSAADDTITSPVTITPSGTGTSTGWTSDLVAPDSPLSGLYTAPNPVPFTIAAASAPKTVTLKDALVPATTGTVVIARPTATLTATLVAASATRQPDGTVTFRANINPANVGPAFTASTAALILEEANPTTVTGAGNYTPGTPVTLTLHNPPSNGSVVVTIADVSYPTAPAPVNITVPMPAMTSYVIGQKSLGAGLQPVLSGGTLPAEWFTYPTLPAPVMVMINGGNATDKISETEVIDLSTVGAVNFTAKFRAHEVSVGSNFETLDRFKAELVYTVGGTPTTVNLISTWDTGAGAPSTTGTGLNGAPDGYLNGYQGAAGTDVVTTTVYATALADYDANKTRDEFNITGAGGLAKIDNVFSLAATIPPNADSVKLLLYGASITGSEGFVVSDVLFASAGPVDTDSDGMDDAYETANGLNPNSAADKFLDLDNDGQSNYAEFLAGTAANNPASKLEFTVLNLGGSNISVTWSSVPGKSYFIQASENLSVGVWTNLFGPVSATATTTTMSGSVGGSVPDRLFIRVVPQ